MLDVQITGTDAAQRHPNDGVTVVLQRRHGLSQKFELSFFDICTGKHCISARLNLLFNVSNVLAKPGKTLSKKDDEITFSQPLSV